MAVWVCQNCGFEYDEAKGLPSKGISPGTDFAGLPDDWCCPDCLSGKHMFEEDNPDSA